MLHCANIPPKLSGLAHQNLVSYSPKDNVSFEILRGSSSQHMVMKDSARCFQLLMLQFQSVSSGMVTGRTEGARSYTGPSITLLPVGQNFSPNPVD